MKFIWIQVIIMVTIILSSILGGKKGAVLASVVWILETFFITKLTRFSNLQFGIIAIAFQIGISLGVFKDFILKKIKQKKLSSK